MTSNIVYLSTEAWYNAINVKILFEKIFKLGKWSAVFQGQNLNDESKTVAKNLVRVPAFIYSTGVFQT